MVIDSSALVAVLRGEPESERFVRAMRETFPRLVAAPTAVEVSVVMLSRFGEAALTDLDALIRETSIEIVPFTGPHVALAIDAFRRFGRGRHPAGLNFGDCFSYALAKATGEPLLFKGDDFSKTDIRGVV
jgi:ribonuclease VapC